MRSAVIGLRLWGIALEPFCPARNGSSTSRTSVRCRWRTSVPNRSMPAPARAIAASSSAWRSRATTCVETVLGVEAEPREHPRLELGAGGRVGADGARDRAHTHLREAASRRFEVAMRLEREAGELDAERRRLGVDAVGAPDAERVAVLAGPFGERPRARRPPGR